MAGPKRTFIDKCFRDEEGKTALVAAPNAPIITWAVAAIGSHLIKHGNVHDALSITALVAIIMWAILEIFLGVNYFRRALGVAVLAFTVFIHIHN